MSILNTGYNNGCYSKFSGFFSSASLRLGDIIEFFNKEKKLPDIVDSSTHFEYYKIQDFEKDITFEYFDHYDIYPSIEYKTHVDYIESYQYMDYSNLEYTNICPFVVKYFSPSAQIKKMIADLEEKYKIEYKNICVLFYRGNDKNRETQICGHDEYIKYAEEVLRKNPNIRFFIQSDETEFIERMLAVFPNSFYMKNEIRHMRKCNDTVDKTMKTDIDKFSKLYLAITIIMSKCEYIICGTGNCSIWIMLYRGNNANVYQNRYGCWIYQSLCMSNLLTYLA